MKRLLQILGFLLLLLIVAAFLLPIVFKDEIIARAKQEINNNIEATVDFKDIDISLIRSFPDFSLGIEELSVDGKDGFEGVRLAEVRDFRVDLNLFSVISGSQFEVKAIAIKDARIHVLVDTAGNANYDIAKSTGEETEETADTSEPSDFKLTLKEYSLENIDLVYDDRQGDMKVNIANLDHKGSGDFTEEIVNLKTTTSMEALTFDYGGIAYLKRVKVNADMDFEFNQPQFKITFKENELELNGLELNFDGFVALPDEDINMDISFLTPQSDFKSILSLIPAVYLQDFEKVQTSGTFALNGMVKGTYNGDNEVYPGFDIRFNVADARFRYPDLPAAVENINIDAHIYNKTEQLDGMVIDVPIARAVVAGSPVNASLNLKTPVSDPAFKAVLKTDFQLNKLADVVPAEGYDYKGRLKADLDFAGRMSDIDNERYENVKADGQLVLQDVELKSDSLPFPVQISAMDMAFSPQKVNLNTLQAKLGRSDISANGTVDNILAYVLQDKTLKGDFVISSSLIDLNELSGGEEETGEEEESVAEEGSAMEVVRLPENVDFGLTASVDKLLYDNLEISNLNGVLQMKEGAVNMENLRMELLSGSLAMSGAYNSRPPSPEVDLDLKINDFGFRESFENFITIQKLAPIMQNTEGSYSAGLNFSSSLNPDMTPDMATIEAEGSLTTRGMSTTTKSLQKLAKLVKNPSLSSLDIGRMDISFKIENGRVMVEPFDLKAGSITARVEGSSGLDQSLDYIMNMKIPASGIGATDLLNKIGATRSGKLDLAVKIGGTFQDPKVSTSLEDLASSVVETVKEQVEQKVEEVKKEAIDKANARAQELIDAAEARGDELIAAAKEQAEKLRQEARKQADKLREEADKRASQLEEEAKGNFIKEKAAKAAADKVRSEAKEGAEKLIKEADDKAESLVKEARDQKEKLVEEAREKARIENS